ncbi:MAG TPA: hypothetical protein VFQ00_03945 [Terriglobales bacterium]|nr:hypothetical protein [Terriglobales bacterium]
MRSILAFGLCLALVGSAVGDQASKREARKQKKAEKEYLAAMNFVRNGQVEKGEALLEDALQLDPHNLAALSARELLKQERIHEEVARANRQLEAGHQPQAIAQLRKALSLDPHNELTQQRLQAVLAQTASAADQLPARIHYRDAGAVELAPNNTKQTFHYKGDSRGLLDRVWNAYGIRPLLDSSVTSRQVRFDMENVDFATAVVILSQMTKTFFQPVSPNQALIVADTPTNRKQFERLALRTFYIGDVSTPQELNDVVNVMRTVFDIRSVNADPHSNQVTVKAPLEMLDAATRILEDLYSGKPQVMLDVNIFQIDQTLARDLGLGLPAQFTLFNVNTEAAQLLSSSGSQLINQLISSGAINQAGNTSIAALLAGLAAGGGSSILNQPLATFGGGLTRSGVIIPGTSAHFSLNKSSLQTIDHVTLRAAQNDAATFRDGLHYPILNASFSPIFNTAAISQVLGNQSFIAPFPSFSYEDLGLTLKTTPTVHGSSAVSLKMEFQLRGLGAAQLNGVPVITNREYSGTITVPFGETAVLAGMVSRSEQLSLQGLAGIAQFPILGPATSLHNKQTEDMEMLVTIRPELVRSAVHNPNSGTVFVPTAAAQ